MTTTRGGRTLPWATAEQRAHAELAQPVLVEHLDREAERRRSEAACSARVSG